MVVRVHQIVVVGFAVASASIAHAQSPLLVIEGDPVATHVVGRAVTRAGDVNQDGAPDFWMGAIDSVSSLRLMSGRDGVILAIVGTPAGASAMRYDVALANLGDLDGDAVDDNAAPGTLSGSSPQEAVFVLSGATGTKLFALTGSASAFNFGTKLGNAGDADADGFDDLVVGAPTSNANGANGGAAFVFSGSSGATLHTINGQSVEMLGAAVDGAGDVDHDGHDDFVVGAPFLTNAGGSHTGGFEVHSGQDAHVLLRWNAPPNLQQLGWLVKGVGDIDQDGTPDVIAGTASASHRIVEVSLAGGAVLQTINNLGDSLDSYGDLDGDGSADFVAGTYCALSAPNCSGEVDVISGASALPLSQWIGLPFDQLGASVAVIGDVDGDGKPDLVAGAPDHRDDVGVAIGAVDVYTIAPCGCAASAASSSPTYGDYPKLQLLGCPNAGNSITVTITHANGPSTALLLFGTTQQFTFFGGQPYVQLLLIDQLLPLIIPIAVSAPFGPGSGMASSPAQVPPGVSNVSIYMQALFDGGGVPASLTSNAVHLVIP